MKQYLTTLDKAHRNAAYIFAIIAFVVFVYIILRSFLVSLTYDESTSFELLIGEWHPLLTANNHLLNSVGAFICSRIFGFSEWSIRLPNVLSYLVYTYFCYKLFVEKTKYFSASIIVLVFLLFNHFVIDYFSLMRGYGMGVAFMMGTIYYFLEAVKTKEESYYYNAVIYSALTVWASYAFVAPLLALHLVYFSQLLLDKRLKSTFRYHLKISILELILLVPCIAHLLILVIRKRIFIGGVNFKQTLDSIYIRIANVELFSQQGLLIFLSIIATLVIGVLLAKGSKRQLPFILATIGVSFCFSVILHLTLRMSYPLGRAALYWVLFFGVALFFILERILETKTILKTIPFLLPVLGLVGITAFSFFKTLNLSYTQGEYRQAETRNIIKLLSEKVDESKDYEVAVSWSYSMPIKYYKKLYNYDWLNIKVILPEDEKIHSDYFYVYAEDLEYIKSNCIDELKQYPTINAHLLRKCQQ